MRPRCAPVMRDQTRKPSRALSTARSTSALLATWTLEITSPVAGLMLSKVSLEVASTSAPWI
jgi:hypothetical protein